MTGTIKMVKETIMFYNLTKKGQPKLFYLKELCILHYAFITIFPKPDCYGFLCSKNLEILLKTGRPSNLEKIETQAISLLVNGCSAKSPLVKIVDFEEKLNFEIDSFRNRI